MASYSIRITRSAAGSIEAIGRKADRQRIVKRIAALADEPRPTGCEKLAGYENRYRVRQGSYRILYSIEDGELLIWVVKVGHLREVYR